MASYELRVKASNWQDAPADERLELSDMDHTMPKVYVQIAEFFQLPEGTDKEAVVSNLKKGLEFTLSQFPILAGSLHMDDKNGRMWVTKKRDSTVGLHVKTMDGDADDFPSFEYLDQRDFPVHLISGHEVLPKSVTEKQLFSPLGDNADDDLIISTFQINFIKGGLILANAIHHNCSDGAGCNGFLSTWAASSAAATHGTPFQPIDKESLNRERLSAARPSEARWKELDGKFPIFKYLGGPPPAPPADFKMPTLKIRTWHFPKSATAKLKAEASAKMGDTWISTYDSIMGILWKTITRAKLPLLNPDLETKTVLAHGLSTRNKLSPPLPESYLGNAVALPRTEPTAIKDILADNNLPELAAAVRASTLSITGEYVAELPEWVAGLEDRRWIAINMSSFLGMDLAGTSWQGMTPYDNHDFGFGLPKAMRWPHPQFEGYVFVLPSRASVKPEGSDEGIEVIVCLEESCHDRLLKDPELLRYAAPRGLDG